MCPDSWLVCVCGGDRVLAPTSDSALAVRGRHPRNKLLRNGHPEGSFANVVIATFELGQLAKDFQADVVNGRLPIFNEQDVSGDEEDKDKGFPFAKRRYYKFSHIPSGYGILDACR